MHLINLTLLYAFALTISSCASKKEVNSTQQLNTESKSYILKYNRGPCFGQCPVYTFYLLSDHTGLVYSKSNLMDTTGWYSTPLDQESVVEILELIEPASWWNQNLANQPEIADLPSSSLTYYHQQGTRTLTIQNKTTQPLEDVFGKLSHLITESVWIATNLRPLESASTPENIIVQLKDDIDIQRWMGKFDRFGITLIKRLSPNQNYYLVTKDPAMGNANDFFQYIKADVDVVGAQWDKEIKERE